MVNPTIRTIAVDVAWTLLHKEPIFGKLAALYSGLDPQGIPITERRVRVSHRAVSEAVPITDQATRDDYLVVNKRLCEVLGVAWNEPLNAQIELICREQAWQPYEDALVPFQFGLPVCVFSNWRSGLRDYLREQLGVEVENVICSTEEGLQKPNPMFYKRGCRKLGLRPEEVLFVGDSLNLDYLPAAGCGLKTVLLDRWGFYEGTRFARIASLDELSDRL